jgi:restriction system protein
MEKQLLSSQMVKPIELLAGSNLLYLLKENADIDAKIIMPDDWVDIRPDE